MIKYLASYDILIVLNRPYPYSNCTENYSKFECLNKCFKGKNMLSKYWYSGDETDGIIKLNYDNNNQTLKKDEGECFKECESEDCKLIYILQIPKFSNDNFKFIKASPLIPPFDYWTQLIGLFVLFTNICFYKIYSQLIDKINLKVKKPKHRRYVTIARYSTLILFGLGFLASFIVNVVDFKNEQTNPIRRVTTFRSIESKSFSIVICILVNNIDKNEKILPLEEGTSEAVVDETLSTLDQKTSKVFDQLFKGIYLDFENKRKQVDFILNPKVIFKYLFNHMHNITHMLRCFHLVPHWKEIRYQSLFSSLKLTIECKHRYYLLYLIPDDQNFNSERYMIKPFQNYIKKITRRSKLKNCVNYREFNTNFRDRWDSVDQCIRRKYINKTGKISFYSIIDRDHYTDDEWMRSYVDRNETEYYKISEECKKENKEEDCYEIKFDGGNEKTPSDNHYFKEIEIELYTQVERVIDEEPSFYKVLLVILNINSILFGLSVPQLFHLINLLIKIKFKVCLPFIYLLCLIGLTYHLFYILNEIIKEDLIYSQHYEVLESIKMAENIFCFEFNQAMIDKNYQLTGNYLNETTNEMRVETVFENISYLSKSNEWITMNSTSKYTSNVFKMETFFFVNKKCFKLKQEVEYDQKQFYFENKKK